MLDSPMHSMNEGIHYLVDADHDSNSSASSRTTPQCWKCNGVGRVQIKSSRADKADMTMTSASGVNSYYKQCSVCSNMITFPSKDKNKGIISKFTNYTTSGPLTCGNCDDPEYSPKEGETLCSLSGNYMIYQYAK